MGCAFVLILYIKNQNQSPPVCKTNIVYAISMKIPLYFKPPIRYTSNIVVLLWRLHFYIPFRNDTLQRIVETKNELNMPLLVYVQE